ncbi:Sec-independent protein translocase subunit TatA/TatB [Neptunitalea lumnitzerae]|uniref:Sec-independent protein translocase protein TatA n=1 Tax=Neptunitalea lumnitzerae TaxID=2965509 RepID=A0ABQ5MKU7_9FLAO|nr:twin-arginine translocase TatA/TatE family subunit [Neptunitalea sp. Y10]GLB50014.1 hypothetical protein Y10_23820 [Neptunitalea sp. Y10]
MFLFISTPEVMFALLVVVLIFGADKVPEIARGLGKGIRQVKDATNDIKHEISSSAEKSGINTDVAKDIQNEINEVKGNIESGIEDITGGPISRRR